MTIYHFLSLFLIDYINLSEEKRQSHEVFSDSELKTIEYCIKQLPNISISSEVKTDGSEDIVVMDYVTIIVKLDRVNLQEGEKAAPVCSRTYPFIKYEKFYLYLTDITGTNIFSYVVFDKNDKVQQKEIRFQAFPQMAGNVVLKLHCFSDSYAGLEMSSEIKFTIKKESEGNREMYVYDEEDMKREPTLIEQVMNGLNEENSDDDVEDDDDTQADDTRGRLFIDQFYIQIL